MNASHAWRSSLLATFYRLAHANELDNFDSERFAGVDPQAFFLSEHLAHLTHFIDHWQDFHAARCLLADDESKSLFDQLILFRLLGHNHVRLPVRDPQRIEVPPDWLVAEAQHTGMFGALRVYSVPLDGDSVWVQCWPRELREYLAGHYYFRRGATNIEPERGDYVVDAGACFGDTAIFFAHRVGPEGRVLSFDPLPKHCEIMRETLLLNGELGQRVQIVEAGLSDIDQVGSAPRVAIDPGARLADEMPMRTLDRMALPRVDFIKMDVEGSELAALRGSEESIRRWRPKLAISLYHRPEDFYAIPQWIHGLELGYTFYLDHYSNHQEETVLYALAKHHSE